MRNTILRIHRWLALPLGVIISIICLSGALLVFEKEIIHFLNAERYSITPPPNGQRLSEEELTRLVEAELEPGMMVMDIMESEDPHVASNAIIAGMGRTEFHVNPYTGEVYGTPVGTELIKGIRALHRFLLNTPEGNPHGAITIGRIVIGLTAIGMALLILTGIMLWWPRNKHMLRCRLKISFGKGWQRFVYDSHVALGFYAAIALLIMALTGPAWSFEWYHKCVETIMPADTKLPELLLSLHTGTWGGTFTRVLYLLAALVGATLPWSGYYIWWKRRKNKHKERTTSDL